MQTVNTVLPGPEALELLHRMDAYRRAAGYLAVGQLYLYDNPLLKRPLELSHVKPLVVGHWGTTPGQNLSYRRANRNLHVRVEHGQCIAKHGRDMRKS